MKKGIFYLVGSLLLLLLVLVIMASRGKTNRRLDERITLRQRDSIPYGTSAAKKLLPSLFPQAEIFHDARYPGAWEAIDIYKGGQAVILVADYFYADDDELTRISRFAARGNTVFIVARSFSDEAANYFSITLDEDYDYLAPGSEDSIKIRLEGGLFAADSLFTYPGKKYDGFIRNRVEGRSVVLGRNTAGSANFIRLQKETGNIYPHTAPLAFSNYFILHKQNIRYYQSVLSVIPGNVKTVLWNEYFLEKLRNPARKKDTNWLAALLKHPPFKWGLFTAMATLLLFALLGMRRKQKLIPPHAKPTNDSMDFVKTLGRLYHDQGDHKNLAAKMAAYFLEHVRSTYKIATHTLDAEFVQMLHMKSDYPEAELQAIVSAIRQHAASETITEEELARFHQQLELFYLNT